MRKSDEWSEKAMNGAKNGEWSGHPLAVSRYISQGQKLILRFVRKPEFELRKKECLLSERLSRPVFGSFLPAAVLTDDLQNNIHL